jgi:glycosyltransferase involved in cell wall biosynthesis
MIKNSFTVVIPNYNHGKYLINKIESLNKQSLPPKEIIIIDDCSTDQSWKIILYLKKKNKNLKSFRNKKNMGVNYSLNFGISHVKTEYFAPSAADDIHLKDFFERALHLFQKHRNKKVNLFVSPPAIYKNKKMFIMPWATLPNKNQTYYSPQEVLNIQNKKNFSIWAHCCALKTKVFKNITFVEDLEIYADWYIINMEALKNGFVFCDKVLAFFKINKKSYSSKFSNKDKLLAIKNTLDFVLEKEHIKNSKLFIKSELILQLGPNVLNFKKYKKYKDFFTKKLIIKLYIVKLKNLIKIWHSKIIELKFVLLNFSKIK